MQSNWVRSPSCKPQIHSHTRVMCFMPFQPSLGYWEQPLVGFDEGVLLPRWDSVSPIQSGEGGTRSIHERRSFTGKTTRELRSALQQLLRHWSREIQDMQHLGSHQKAIQVHINSSSTTVLVIYPFFDTQLKHSLFGSRLHASCFVTLVLDVTCKQCLHSFRVKWVGLIHSYSIFVILIQQGLFIYLCLHF